LSNKKLNATQKKLLEIIENSEKTVETYKDKQPFDFVCINNYCSGKEDKRVLATAWKSKKESYRFFCHICGHETELTKKEFKVIRDGLSREQAYQNMEKEKKARKERTTKEAA
jgi:hypothetical protein